jgi:hypothetical protein
VKVTEVIRQLLEAETPGGRYSSVEVSYDNHILGHDDFLIEYCTPNAIRPFQIHTKRRYVPKSQDGLMDLGFDDDFDDGKTVKDFWFLLGKKDQRLIVIGFSSVQILVIGNVYPECEVPVKFVEYKFGWSQDGLTFGECEPFVPECRVSEVLVTYGAVALSYPNEPCTRTLGDVLFIGDDGDRMILKQRGQGSTSISYTV